MPSKTDEKTPALIKDINQKKDEIAKLEKPNWKTNCSFSYYSINGKLIDPPINIHEELK